MSDRIFETANDTLRQSRRGMTIASDISSRLRANRSEWLPKVFPAGRIERGMFMLGNADGDAGRSFPIPLDGRKAESLSDFGGERIGDDLDLYCRGTRQTMSEAVKELAARFGSEQNGTPHNSTSTAAPPPSPDSHSLVRNADATWRYYDAHGRLVLVHCRRNKRDAAGKLVLDSRGKPKKDFYPLSWSRKGWETKWPDRIPLYNLSEVLQRRDCDIVMVEGEKDADEARKLLPDMVATTWAGSDAGLSRTDLSPLRNRRVTIWPDADLNGAGAIKAQKAAELAQKAGAASVHIVNLPVGLPDSWGLADTMPADWSVKTIAELIDTASAVKANRLENEAGPFGPEPPIDDGRIEPKHQDDDTFPTLSLADCLARQSEPTRWLIDGVLPERGLACVFGRSNSFKSFVVIDQACHIAHGRPYHGRAVIQAPAMYLALEGSSGVIRQRVPGWHRHYGLLNTEPQLAVIETPVTLTKAPDAEKLKRTALALWGRLPGLIVVDVLKRTMDGSETDDEVVARFIHSLQTIFLTDREPCLILVITHSGFSVDERARGHSDLWGSYDTRLIAEGDKEHLTTCLTVERHKDAESGGAIAFNMKVVETGMIRDDMAPITTLVPVADETGVSLPKAQATKKNKLAPAAQIALDLLQKVLIEAGERKQGRGDIPGNVSVVPVELWRQRCYAKGLADSDDPGKKGDAERKAFNRTRKELEAKGIVATDAASKWVWIVQSQVGKAGQAGHVPGQGPK